MSSLNRTPRTGRDKSSARFSRQMLHVLLSLTVTWVAGGAACYRRAPVTEFAPPPEIFQSVPTLEELVSAVNRTDRITKLQTNSARVTAPTISNTQLSASLMLERPKRFRLRGSIRPLPTTLVDLGSNEQVFWLQVPEGMRPTLYYARHSEYASQSRRMILPVDPTWLIDALGLVHIDPAQVTDGPTRRPDGQLEIRSELPMPDGLYRRVCVIDSKAGFVTEQYLYGQNNQLVARATAKKHHYYEEFDCSLPHEVRVELQPAAGPPLSLEMKIGDYTLNQILSGDPRLFAMPTDAGDQWDLAKLGGPPPGAANFTPPEGWSTPLPAESPPPGNPDAGPFQPSSPEAVSSAAPDDGPLRRAESSYVQPHDFSPRLRGLMR